MAFQDREEIVATIQETYVLMGRAIRAEIPGAIVEHAIREDVVQDLLEIPIEYLTDQEMLGMFQEVYFELVENVLEVQRLLLEDSGEEFDDSLQRVGLTGAGRSLKVSRFRRAVDGVRNFMTRGWVKKAFRCGNIILGSLGPVPVVGIAVEPIKELKESIEAQGEEDAEDR